MPELKIVGYETGKKRFDLKDLLIELLGLEGEEAEKMRVAIMDGTGITLTIDDEETAVGLGQQLMEAGAKVEISGT